MALHVKYSLSFICQTLVCCWPDLTCRNLSKKYGSSLNWLQLVWPMQAVPLPYKPFCFKIQMNVFWCYANVCSLQKHIYLFVCLQCYWSTINSVIFSNIVCMYCIFIVICCVFRSIYVPDVTRASSRRLQKIQGELFTASALPHSLCLLVCWNSCTARRWIFVS